MTDPKPYQYENRPYEAGWRDACAGIPAAAHFTSDVNRARAYLNGYRDAVNCGESAMPRPETQLRPPPPPRDSSVPPPPWHGGPAQARAPRPSRSTLLGVVRRILGL